MARAKSGEGDAELLGNTCRVWPVTKKPDGEPLKCRCPQRNMTAQMPSPDARIMDKLPGDHGQGEREGKKACI